MSRRRWVYTQGGVPLPEPIEVTEDWTNTLPRAQTPTEQLVYGDIRATDGTDLSTRRRHREYMKQHGLTIADDFKGEWEQAAKKREKFYQGDFDHRERRDDIARAIHQLSNGRRR